MSRSCHHLLRRSACSAFAALALSAGCASHTCPEREVAEIEVEVYRKAETERAAQLAREVGRLRADLAQAEEALVRAESGLRDDHSRADAVSSLAEARIRVERATERAPWRSAELEEASAKLDEAAHQIAEGRYGSALFFAYRAQRTAETIEAEVDLVHTRPELRYLGAGRVNMRSGPSTGEPVLCVLEGSTPVFVEGRRADWLLVRASTGDVGWVHRSLIRRP